MFLSKAHLKLKHIWIPMVLSILVFACDKSIQPKKPEHLISKDQMSEILYDLYVVSAAKGVNRKILEKEGIHPKTYILKKHNIDSAKFAESNTYYAYDAETYKSIVEKVKARLESEKKMFEAIRERETDSIKRRRDSLNKKRVKKDSEKTKIDTLTFKNTKISRP